MLCSTLDTVLNSREVEMNYLTPKDLARRFQISERQITHLARVGYLPGIKTGKLWRFQAEAIEVWEKGQYDIGKMADEIVKEVNG